MQSAPNAHIPVCRRGSVPPAETVGWFLQWLGPETLAPAAAQLAEQGQVVILAQSTAVGLAPPLPDEIIASTHTAHPQGYLIRRGIARALAAQILGGGAQDHPLATDSAGAPSFSGEALHVSFSARGEMAAIALGRAPLGVDYEPALPLAGIPWNLLRKDERAALSELAPAQQSEAFLTLWRAKEATLKALRLGFSCPPESVRIDGARARVEAHPHHFRLISSPEAGLTLAVCMA